MLGYVVIFSKPLLLKYLSILKHKWKLQILTRLRAKFSKHVSAFRGLFHKETTRLVTFIVSIHLGYSITFITIYKNLFHYLTSNSCFHFNTWANAVVHENHKVNENQPTHLVMDRRNVKVIDLNVDLTSLVQSNRQSAGTAGERKQSLVSLEIYPSRLKMKHAWKGTAGVREGSIAIQVVRTVGGVLVIGGNRSWFVTSEHGTTRLSVRCKHGTLFTNHLVVLCRRPSRVRSVRVRNKFATVSIEIEIKTPLKYC